MPERKSCIITKEKIRKIKEEFNELFLSTTSGSEDTVGEHGNDSTNNSSDTVDNVHNKDKQVRQINHTFDQLFQSIYLPSTTAPPPPTTITTTTLFERKKRPKILLANNNNNNSNNSCTKNGMNRKDMDDNWTTDLSDNSDSTIKNATGSHDFNLQSLPQPPSHTVTATNTAPPPRPPPAAATTTTSVETNDAVVNPSESLVTMSILSKAMTLHGQGGVGGHFSKREYNNIKKKYCPLCVKGSKKLIGHKGKHQMINKRVFDSTKECPSCVPGSGRMEGHKGRHTLIEKKKYAEGAPCPQCSLESGKKAGHRGKHVIVKQFDYDEDDSENDSEEEDENSGDSYDDESNSSNSSPASHAGAVQNKVNEDMLPEYERRRLENIARNQAKLAELGFGGKSMFRKKKIKRSSRKKQKLKQTTLNLPPRILPKRKRVEPTYFKDEQARQMNISSTMEEEDLFSEDDSGEDKGQSHNDGNDDDEEWLGEDDDDAVDEKDDAVDEKAYFVNTHAYNQKATRPTVTRKRGRPKKGTRPKTATKERILQSKRSVVRVTKSLKINQFQQSYHNGSFTQIVGAGMKFLRRYNLISNSSLIPKSSFQNIKDGNGLGRTKVFGPLMLPQGTSVKLYKYLTPKLDNIGRVPKQYQKTHLLVAKHKTLSLSNYLSKRKRLDDIVRRLRNAPVPDKIKLFECRTKLMCEICYAKFINLRYLASHRTACAKRGGVWEGPTQSRAARGKKAHVRFFYNEPSFNSRKVRRMQRSKMTGGDKEVMAKYASNLANREMMKLGDGKTVVHVLPKKKKKGGHSVSGNGGFINKHKHLENYDNGMPLANSRQPLVIRSTNGEITSDQNSETKRFAKASISAKDHANIKNNTNKSAGSENFFSSLFSMSPGNKMQLNVEKAPPFSSSPATNYGLQTNSLNNTRGNSNSNENGDGMDDSMGMDNSANDDSMNDSMVMALPKDKLNASNLLMDSLFG